MRIDDMILECFGRWTIVTDEMCARKVWANRSQIRRTLDRLTRQGILRRWEPSAPRSTPCYFLARPARSAVFARSRDSKDYVD